MLQHRCGSYSKRCAELDSFSALLAGIVLNDDLDGRIAVVCVWIYGSHLGSPFLGRRQVFVAEGARIRAERT